MHHRRPECDKQNSISPRSHIDPYGECVASALDADLAVIGAGPAGATAALFAARLGHRVVVLDRARFPRDKPCGEGLLPIGRALLEELGLEARAVAAGAPPFRGIQFGLVGQAQTVVPFPAPPYGGEGLGVRRVDFDALLAEALKAHPLIEFRQETSVLAVETAPGRTPSVLSSAGELRPRWVAVADGLRSGIRHRLGWTVGPRPPHRYGVVSHWRVEGPPDPWVRITIDHGLEVYEGPVAGSHRLVALLCTHDRMRQFAGRLEAHYREIVLSLRPEFRAAEPSGTVTAVGPFRYRARTVASDGVFLVGDAAGFTDPISGEGLASGMRQARAFAHAVGEPSAERNYRLAHRRLTRDPRRVAELLVYFSRSPSRVERGLRGLRHAPNALTHLLGANFGYWGLSRVTPREWVALLSGW
jgi:2-polyprenyl-6-methoxyphenol hydroxylase-like FAD-dependent oxidoreductase